jgi:hypothetical protein
MFGARPHGRTHNARFDKRLTAAKRFSMFKHRTLFAIGAGASAEVDIPVGTALAHNISKLLNIQTSLQTPGDRLLRQLYEKFPLADNGYHRAAATICNGVRLANSIDDFLDRHSANELIQRVGKTAIVKAILDAEGQSLLNYDTGLGKRRINIDRLENTWFMKFFRMLGAEVKVSNVRQIFDDVAFIVFNYDRCLEFFLFNALQLVYRISPNDATAIIADRHIIHPYGVVAALGINSGGIPFGGAADYEFDYVGLSAGVKIFTEQMAAGEILTQIHQEMSSAEQIVFLGFGYHNTNMTLLRPRNKMRLKPVFGTALGMSDNSIDVVRHQLAVMFDGAPHGIIPAMQISDMKSAALFDYHAKTLPE